MFSSSAPDRPSSAAIAPVTQNPGITIDKSVSDASGDRLAQPGEVLTYTFTVRNTGDVPLRDVVVDDEKLSAEPIACAVEIAPGGSATCTATYTVTDADVASGAVRNVAAASGTTPADGPVTSPTDDVTIPVASIRPP